MMREKKIKIDSIYDAKELVALANKCDFDIDVYYNRIAIDGKSIIGVLSIDFNYPISVQYNGENAEFESFLDAHSYDKHTAA